MKKECFKGFWSYLFIALSFVAVACVYCFPELEGKKILASDAQQPRAAVQESVEYAEKTGDYTFWTNSMFSGMPNYQIGGGAGGLVSNKILKPFRYVALAGHRATIPILIAYFVAFFLLLRTFRIDKWISAAGAFAIAYSSYFFVIIAASHNGKCSTISWTTLTLVGFLLVFRKKYGWGAFVVMFSMAMAFTVHPQMAYYLCLLIGLLFCAELYMHIREKRLKDLLLATGVFAASFAVGLGINGGSVFTNKEYVQETMRGGHSELRKETDGENKTGGLDLDYATAWSYGIDETMTFLIPNYMGGCNGYNLGENSVLYKQLVAEGVPPMSASAFCESAPTYWGDQPFTAGPVYLGAVVCFLFVLSLYVVKGPYKWALLAATIFSVLLSWGYHFMPLTKLFYNFFPMYNKFRAVSSILIVAEITVPLLGFLALKNISEGKMESEKMLRAIRRSAMITGGICLLFALFGGTLCSFVSRHDAQFVSQMPDFVYQAILAQRKSMMTSDAWRSLVFVLLGASLTYTFAKGKISQKTFGILLALVVLLDMWPVNKRFFNESNYSSDNNIKEFFAPKLYEKQLMADIDLSFRIVDFTTNTFNDARPSYYLKSVGGYSAAKLRRYQDLIDQHLTKGNLQVYNMLNTKYFIIKDAQGKAVPQLNPEAFGNVWFVDSLAIADNANEENDALSALDLRHVAVLDKKFSAQVENLQLLPDSLAQIALTRCTPKELIYASQTSHEAVAVFSEIYYPHGWQVTIDGEPAEHFRADYTLRAMRIPAGKHEIRFLFAPESARKGDVLATSCLALMFFTLLAAAGWEVYANRKKE